MFKPNFVLEIRMLMRVAFIGSSSHWRIRKCGNYVNKILTDPSF